MDVNINGDKFYAFLGGKINMQSLFELYESFY